MTHPTPTEDRLQRERDYWRAEAGRLAQALQEVMDVGDRAAVLTARTALAAYAANLIDGEA